MKRKAGKKGLPIFIAQTLSYLIIILFITITFSLLFFSTAKSHLEHEVGARLQDIASIAARNTPVERLTLIKVGDEQTRMVLRLKEKLGEIHEATGVENIAVFRPDRTSLLDMNPDVPIGTKYMLPHFNEDYLSHLARNEAVCTGSYRNSTGQWFMSAYAPVRDSDSQLFAIVGVNAGAKEIEVIEKMRIRLYLITIVGVVFSFVLALILARTFTRPISKIAQTADRVGQGDYKARAELPSASELRILADSINSMAKRVQRRDEQLKELSAGVAHEIRNPLNSIKLLVSLLGEELSDQPGKSPAQILDTLHYEIGKLNRFLTEFLTYSRPITLSQDRVNPAELVNAAIEMTKAEANEKEIEIIVVIESDLPIIKVDRNRMEQSLLNLLLNAVQACPPKGQVDLELKKDGQGRCIEFVVVNDGKGILEEKIGEIFDPFFTTKDSGTGLGLSNARKIVLDHSGEITVQNTKDRGARFTIRLPLSDPHGEEIENG